MIRWWFAVSLSGLVLAFILTGIALLSGQVIPARLLSYPQGDVQRGAYFIHLIDIQRGLDSPFSNLPVGYCCLNWSPDGRYLMTLTPAVDGAPGRYELALLERETGQVIWNSGNIGYTSGITAWSPDSRHLLYDSNAQGNGDQALYMLTITPDRFSVTPLLPEGQYNHQVANARAWSADGKWIVFGVRQIQTPIYHLYDVETGEGFPLPQGEHMREPTFGSMASQLAFNRRTLSESQLIVTDVDCLLHVDCAQAEQRVTLVPLASLQTWPTWSPDGNRLAYSLGFGAASGIYMVNAQFLDSQSSRLIDNPGDEWFLSWSLDGRDIAYLSNGSGTDELYRVEVETGAVYRLTVNDHVDGPPAWVP
jgi:TolB protein